MNMCAVMYFRPWLAASAAHRAQRMTRSSTFKHKTRVPRRGSNDNVKIVYQEDVQGQWNGVNSEEELVVRAWEEVAQECLLTIIKVQAWTKPRDFQTEAREDLFKKLESWYQELNGRLETVRRLRADKMVNEGHIIEPPSFIGLALAEMTIETESMKTYMSAVTKIINSENDDSVIQQQKEGMEHQSDAEICSSPASTITSTLSHNKGEPSESVLHHEFITNAYSTELSVSNLFAPPTPSIQADVLYEGLGYMIARDHDSNYHPIPHGIKDTRLLICI